METFPNLSEVLSFTFVKGSKMPWFESSNLEYKRSLSPVNRDAYVKAVCGLLNLSGGGCIIFGVEDNGSIVGFLPSKKNKSTIDDFKLFADEIVNRQLVYTSGSCIPLQSLIVHDRKISKTEYVVIFACVNKTNETVVVARTGEEYQRGNASTLIKNNSPRWYLKCDVDHLVNQARKQLLAETEKGNKRQLMQQKNYMETLLTNQESQHIIDIKEISDIIYQKSMMEKKLVKDNFQINYYCLGGILFTIWVACIVVFIIFNIK